MEHNNTFPKYFDFPFELDEFQINGCQSIAKNENLLATAHTGAGKTVLALYAIAKTLHDKNKVIYVSPIKALSNQKYNEFSKNFNSIGIITGDIKINPPADLLIMTAEILRNSLLYNTSINTIEHNSDIPVYVDLTNVKCVILDEIHYINNAERGKVWEDIICNLNKDVQLVMLSATISGAEDIISWVTQLKEIKCSLVSTTKRPIPLHHGIWWDDEIHYVLKEDKWQEGIWSRVKTIVDKKIKFNECYLLKCIKYLYSNNMSPINIFLLNKSAIDHYAKSIDTCFVTVEERILIENIWNKHLLYYKNIYGLTEEWNFIYSLVLKGVGIHHANLIPILKEIIEILYSEGLIKILFATETFALGVNMPTKTVLFYNMYKTDNKKSKRLLLSEEYNQMAGRAGRRGKDIKGTVIILPSYNFISENDAKHMMITKPQKILSKFELDPIFILKQINCEGSIDIDYVYNKCKNTLLYYQYNNKHNMYTKLLEENMNKLNTIKCNYFDNDDENIAILIEKYNRYIYIQQNINGINGIKLDNKLYKKLLIEKHTIEKKYKSNFSHIECYIDILNKNNDIKKIIESHSFDNLLKSQINILIEFIKNNNLYNTNNKIFPIGKIISQINECNPFLLGHLINNDTFKSLDFPEVAAICSIFINENKSIEKYYNNKNNINISSDGMKVLESIITTCEYYISQETLLNNSLPYRIELDWNLYIYSFNYIKEWAEGKSWIEIINNNKLNISQGVFIKIILRLINILKNIENICNVFNDIVLLNTLNGFEEKLLRNNVINTSLYIQDIL